MINLNYITFPPDDHVAMGSRSYSLFSGPDRKFEIENLGCLSQIQRSVPDIPRNVIQSVPVVG